MVVVGVVLVLVQEEKGPSQARSYPIGESPHAIFRAAGKRFEKSFITPDAENNSSADSYSPSVWMVGLERLTENPVNRTEPKPKIPNFQKPNQTVNRNR